jgi:hypothetical protein
VFLIFIGRHPQNVFYQFSVVALPCHHDRSKSHVAIAFRMEEFLNIIGFMLKNETTGYRMVLAVVKNRIYLTLSLGETYKFM